MSIEENFIESYTNLLIRQYKDQPKAIALIELMVRCAYNDFAFLNFVDWFDIAVKEGEWLDKIGNLFGAYRNILPTDYRDDEFYRLFIKFKIISLSSNHSVKDITNLYHLLFGDNVVVASEMAINTMTVNLSVVPEYFEFMQVLYANDNLPIPIGVEIKIMIKQSSGGFFSYLALKTADIVNGNITPEQIDTWRLQNASLGYIDINSSSTLRYLDISDFIIL
jgi:hypothetical protein